MLTNHATDSELSDTSAAAEQVDDLDAGPPPESEAAPDQSPRIGRWRSVLAYLVLPVMIVALSGLAGWLKWVDGSARAAQLAADESVRAAREITVELLSYQPDTVGDTLTAAQSRLTGAFRESYGQLIQEVVIPGAQEQKISAIANVTAAASVAASADRATVLVFVNQTSIVGTDAPTDTASSVQVGLEKVDGQWLVSDFTPI
ncbi:hypothetical protein FIV07_06120 [Mycobacterium sp. THAF192]|nr:hypothetical protein FIV07_06120 [Mycobacterium sp. THAF192]